MHRRIDICYFFPVVRVRSCSARSPSAPTAVFSTGMYIAMMIISFFRLLYEGEYLNRIYNRMWEYDERKNPLQEASTRPGTHETSRAWGCDWTICEEVSSTSLSIILWIRKVKNKIIALNYHFWSYSPLLQESRGERAHCQAKSYWIRADLLPIGSITPRPILDSPHASMILDINPIFFNDWIARIRSLLVCLCTKCYRKGPTKSALSAPIRFYWIVVCSGL